MAYPRPDPGGMTDTLLPGRPSHAVVEKVGLEYVVYTTRSFHAPACFPTRAAALAHARAQYPDLPVLLVVAPGS